MPPKNSPADTPSTGKDDASQARGPLAGIGELASFLFAGLGALVRFFGPQPELEMKVDLETKASAAERIEELAAKVAPFPVQDG